MSQDSSMLSVAAAMARHAATRQTVLSQNIANADTPGFKAHDVEPFRLDMVARMARAERLGSAAGAVALFRTGGLEATNGNDVTLEDQMIRASETRRAHDMATTLFRKSIDLMRLGLGRAR